MSDNSEIKVNNGKSDIYLSLFYSFLFVLLVSVDQFTKKIIDSEMLYNAKREIIPNFFYLHYVRNTGSAFSLFADKPWGIYMLSAVSVILGIGIFVLMVLASKRSMKLISLALCLLSSGAIGNLIDRIMLRYVIDFLRFDFGSYTFPIFNFADICAVCGTVLLIGIIIFDSKSFENLLSIVTRKKEEKTEEKSDEKPEDKSDEKPDEKTDEESDEKPEAKLEEEKEKNNAD
jgi:signal peptidase II